MPEQPETTWNDTQTTPNKPNKARPLPLWFTNGTDRHSMAWDSI